MPNLPLHGPEVWGAGSFAGVSSAPPQRPLQGHAAVAVANAALLVDHVGAGHPLAWNVAGCHGRGGDLRDDDSGSDMRQGLSFKDCDGLRADGYPPAEVFCSSFSSPGRSIDSVAIPGMWP